MDDAAANRVHLAKLLKSGGNVLLLDEPTNDLDVDTLRALEAGLEAFPGCVVVISHDRWFLDRIATHVLAFESDSAVRWFEGNFTEYEAFRHRELGVAADQPHRIRCGWPARSTIACRSAANCDRVPLSIEDRTDLKFSSQRLDVLPKGREVDVGPTFEF